MTVCWCACDAKWYHGDTSRAAQLIIYVCKPCYWCPLPTWMSIEYLLWVGLAGRINYVYVNDKKMHFDLASILFFQIRGFVPFFHISDMSGK